MLKPSSFIAEALRPLPGIPSDGPLLSAVFHASNVPLALVERGMIIVANDAFAQLFAYRDARQLVGQRLGEILPAEHLCTLAAWDAPSPAATSINSGNGGTRCGESHCVFNARRCDGSFARMESTCSVLHYDGHEILVLSARDISLAERREVEREPEKRFRAIFDWAAVGIAQVNLDGKVVECNHALENMLGYSRGDLKNLSFTSITHPADMAAGLELYRQLIVGKREHYHCEKRYLRKDGRTIWGHLTVSLVRSSAGDPEFAIGMVEDISERKLAERELQEAQKMEAVGRLVGGVAHDFNNLLTAITLYSDLLLASLETTSKQHRHGEEIRMAAERGATLIQQLLAFVRPQAPHPEVLAVDMILADMKNMLSRLIGEHIELITTTDDRLWPVKMDVAEIQQVILNLALNGRDAMPEGGRLHISLRNLGSQQVESDVPPSNYLELCVQDTGSGMDAETRSHLFEPFFTTKPKGKGNGLGLVTVQRIVVQNRGVIRVDSELGRGTTVRVLFPAEVAAAEQNSEHENAPENLAGHETVLLVEDEVAVRESIRGVLVGNGYNVIEARNGQEALNIARDYSGIIDLLVTDIVLPGMGGREVALRLRHSRPQARVLYISGYSHEARMQLQGKEMVLAKPFTGETLARKVREALNQEAHSSQ